MKETLAGYVTNNFLRGVILLNIKRQYMKEGDTIAVNITNNLRRVVLLGTKRQYTKESNNLPTNETIKQLKRTI